MEKIIKFKAKDGKEFDIEGECTKYENLINDINLIMSNLPAKPSDCEFTNGGGYLQHCRETLFSAKLAFLNLCKVYVNTTYVNAALETRVGFMNLGRVLDDSNISPLYSSWIRFVCIDENLREWGQPYYANNPEQGKNKRLN